MSTLMRLKISRLYLNHSFYVVRLWLASQIDKYLRYVAIDAVQSAFEIEIGTF